LTRYEAVDFYWGSSTSPGAGLPTSNWSVRWTGYVRLPATGSYTFQVTADDGIRAWVDGQQYANRWSAASTKSYTSSTLTGAAGTLVPVVVEHYDSSGDSTARLRWRTPSQPSSAAVSCAAENGTCTLPAGVVTTVWYGAGTSWTSRMYVSGSIGCSNAVFGDPISGTFKSCRYDPPGIPASSVQGSSWVAVPASQLLDTN
jgi:hypothetical protein